MFCILEAAKAFSKEIVPDHHFFLIMYECNFSSGYQFF
jgi:hypothetical protein